MRSASATIERAAATISRATGEVAIRRRLRSNSVTPRYSSSFLICTLSVDWLMWQASAARAKCPASASATR
jgi:hypothetical protein